ncbi:50S ribosomal protein L23 [Patescibacteria group bacterium]|nr:50S ribosomal protein L23 [Patescibacteria group bacterium]MBU1612820.1 50S ribosomal protein L23 [Patescibacteria group bacterium]
MGLLDRWKNKKKEELLKGNADKIEKKLEKIGEAKDLKKKDEKKETKAVKTKTAPKEEEKQRAVKTTEIAYRILLRPLVTEKSAIAQSLNKYSFVVAKYANKNQVKQAVQELYGVKPLFVNMANIDGRRVRFGRSMGRRSDYKKAVVTLPKGKSIIIHEGV